MTIFCPGMGKSRGTKAWLMSAYHEAELAADFGGLTNLKVSHLSISVEGKVGLGRNCSKHPQQMCQPSPRFSGILCCLPDVLSVLGGP